MKATFKFPMTAVLFVAAIVPALTSLDKAAVETKIQKAVGHFLNPKSSQTDCQGAFISLIEAIEEIAPESGFPAEFGAKIKKARQIFDSTSIMNPDGINLLNEAYAAINDGRPYRFPKELIELDAILAHFKTMSAGAQKSLETGQTGAAVKSVLEILIMIVTPVEAPN